MINILYFIAFIFVFIVITVIADEISRNHKTTYPCWVVKYKDGKKTRHLYKAEAEGLRDVFKGELYFDEEYYIENFKK